MAVEEYVRASAVFKVVSAGHVLLAKGHVRHLCVLSALLASIERGSARHDALGL